MPPRKSSQQDSRVFVPEISDEEATKLDNMCKRLIEKNTDPEIALLKGMEKGHYSVNFFNRMMGNHGANGKAAAIKHADLPAILDLLYVAGLNLRFDDDALAVKAAELGEWKTLDYLINFHGLPPAVRDGLLFQTAIDTRNREALLVLLSGLKENDATWDAVGQKLVAAQWWQGITDLYRSSKKNFRKLLATTDILKLAASSGAGYLSVASVRILASETPPTFPAFTEEESKASKGFAPFYVNQLHGIYNAQVKFQMELERVEEEELSALKPSAITAQKTDY